MNLLQDTNLAHYTTMRLGGVAKFVIAISSEQELIEAVQYAKVNNLKFIVIGEGSNIIFGDAGFDGVVILNKIPGLLIDQQTGIVRIGAGTDWHKVVTSVVDAGLVGIEALAFIPGTAGATPINNVGAYGQEISDVLQSVHAFDTETSQFVELSNEQCVFSYRNSLFKTSSYGRYIISSITLQLKQTPADYQAPNYAALQAELMRRELLYPTPKEVMETVIAIRMAKLPNPALTPNTGSFFKNPIVPKEKIIELLATYPELPHYPQKDESEKLAAGWLIENVGLKGFKDHNILVSDKQALVLINDGTGSFADLQSMVDRITASVLEKFGIRLEIEPEIFT